MQTYFRILSYARPFGRFIPVYIGYTLLAIVFGLMNFTLLKPLFDVIFEQVAPESLEKYRIQPEFTLSLDYLISLFNHLFLEVSLGIPFQPIYLPLRSGAGESACPGHQRDAHGYF